jgi:hypothetical protein
MCKKKVSLPSGQWRFLGQRGPLAVKCPAEWVFLSRRVLGDPATQAGLSGCAHNPPSRAKSGFNGFAN